MGKFLRAVMSTVITTSHMWLLIKIKIHINGNGIEQNSVAQSISHISRAQCPDVVSGYMVFGTNIEHFQFSRKFYRVVLIRVWKGTSSLASSQSAANINSFYLQIRCTLKAHLKIGWNFESVPMDPLDQDYGNINSMKRSVTNKHMKIFKLIRNRN